MQDPKFNTDAPNDQDDQDFLSLGPAISKALEEWAQDAIKAERDEKYPSLQRLKEKNLLPSRFIAGLPEKLYGIDLILSDQERKDPLAIRLVVQALLKQGISNHHDLSTAWSMVTDGGPNFWEAAKKALSMEANHQPEAWRASIQTLAQHLADHPAQIGIIGDEHEAFVSALNDWKAKTSVRDVWTYERTFSWFPYHCSSSGLFARAILMDVQFGTRLLDTMGIPPMGGYVLGHWAIMHDKDLLLSVIRESPTVLTAEESTDWNGSITAPMAMEFYKHHVERLYETIRRARHRDCENNELSEFTEKEAPELFQAAAETILQRSDGIFLASNYLCHLMQWREIAENDRWSPSHEYAKAIVHTLATKTNLDNLKRMLAWSPQPDDVLCKAQELGISTARDAKPTVEDLSTVITILTEAKTLEENASELISLFEQALFASNNGIHDSRYSDRVSVTPLHYNLAMPYAYSESPAKCWAKTWHLLSGVRFRCRQTPFASDEAAPPSGALLTAVLVGLALFDKISQDNQRKEESTSLLNSLWNAAYGIWLDLSTIHRGAWDSILNNIFVRRSMQCSTATPPYIDEIKRMFSQLGGATRMVALAACSLQLNISPKIMDEIREAVTPQIQAFLESEQDTRIKQNKHLQLIEACKKFLHNK